MSNDQRINRSGVNTDKKVPDLDALFQSARVNEPALVDDNFTKAVLNQIPDKPLYLRTVAVSESRKRSLSHDFMGFFLGMLAAFLFIDPARFDLSTIIARVNALLPNSITISLVHIIYIGVVVMSATAIAWWWVERRGKG